MVQKNCSELLDKDKVGVAPTVSSKVLVTSRCSESTALMLKAKLPACVGVPCKMAEVVPVPQELLVRKTPGGRLPDASVYATGVPVPTAPPAAFKHCE